MHLPAAALDKRRTQLLANRAEGDSVDAGAVGRFKPHPNMRLADLLGVGDGMPRQRDRRLGIA